MPANSTTSFSAAGEGLFAPDEIRRLMRIEFERAQRYGYPIVCTMISVDRLGVLQDFYGVESRREILQSVVELLESETRASDYLGCMVDDRILAVFPHTSVQQASFMTKRLLTGTRRLAFDGDGRTLRITLSIGISHSEDKGAISFETLLHVAEEGLRVAESGGGDRAVETELYQLYERRAGDRRPGPLEGAIAPLPTPREQAPAPEPAPPAPAPPPEPIRIVDEEAVAEAARLAREERDRLHQTQAREQAGQIELLERRITKLMEQLGMTEQQLQRVMKMKSVDPGLASIYKSVQGLDDGDAQAEVKKELMAKIFEANLSLRKLRDEQRKTNESGD